MTHLAPSSDHKKIQDGLDAISTMLLADNWAAAQQIFQSLKPAFSRLSPTDPMRRTLSGMAGLLTMKVDLNLSRWDFKSLLMGTSYLGA